MPKRSKAPPKPIEVSDAEKLEILNRHCVTGPGWTSLDETQWCLHCAKTFTGRSVRVYRDPNFPDGYSIECGTPGCDGSPIDWHEPDSDFAIGVTEEYAEEDRKSMTDRELHEEEAAPDPNYEDCGDYGPQVDITPEYRDDAQRERFRSVLWQESGGTKKSLKVHPELVKILRTAAKEAYRRVYTAHFGVVWMEKWKIAFRSRVDGWADPDMDEAIQVEVEFASDGDYEELPGELFEQMYNLTNEEATEQALLGDLQGAVGTYLNLHAPELEDDEHLQLQMAIIGYGGG